MTTTKKNILLLSLFCIIMVTVRIIKTDQLSFIFLIWNLFLAFIPIVISNYTLKQYAKLSKTKLLSLGTVWLLFLPNAPYMVTDLFHLHKRVGLPIWYDLVLILMFAITGLYLFYNSIQQAIIVLNNKLPKVNTFLFLIVLFIVVSYGVYIGRFLRLNSWDIIHPFGLANKCLSTIFYLPRFKDMSSFTLIYSLFLGSIYLLYHPNSKPLKINNA